MRHMCNGPLFANCDNDNRSGQERSEKKKEISWSHFYFSLSLSRLAAQNIVFSLAIYVLAYMRKKSGKEKKKKREMGIWHRSCCVHRSENQIELTIYFSFFLFSIHLLLHLVRFFVSKVNFIVVEASQLSNAKESIKEHAMTFVWRRISVLKHFLFLLYTKSIDRRMEKDAIVIWAHTRNRFTS